MPEVSWNTSIWDGGFSWENGGEVWSEAWGGSEAQWFGSLYPRLHRMLPAKRMLEIAPGFGRWTRFLIPACSGYLGIDLSAQCVTSCQTRFRDAAHAHFVKNDGLSLSDAPDGSFDFVFSFDSLVHAEFDVFESYVPQILRKLTPNGVAFLHHSNYLGMVQAPGLLDHARGRSVSAENVEDLIVRSGGRLIVQEVINWVETGLLDCLTMFGTSGSSDAAPPIRLVNPTFMFEAKMIRDFQSHYGVASRPG